MTGRCRAASHHFEEYGVRVEKIPPTKAHNGRRFVWVLAQCRVCGLKARQRWRAEKRGDWEDDTVDRMQNAS